MTRARFILVLVPILCARTGLGDESAWHPYFAKLARSYEITVGPGDETRPLKLRREPLTNWSQPVRGGSHGAVYLWTDGQRPAVIATIFIWPNGDQFGVCHELQSLSESSLLGRSGDRVWKCPKGGVAWIDLDVRGTSTARSRARLQAREIARRLELESTSRENESTRLRVLPRPLYEYADPDDGPAHGAVLGYVDGTDLEAVAVVEAHADGGGGVRWRCALARMTDYAVVGRWGDREVWSVPVAEYERNEEAYFTGTPEYRKAPPRVEPEPQEGPSGGNGRVDE